MTSHTTLGAPRPNSVSIDRELLHQAIEALREAASDAWLSDLHAIRAKEPKLLRLADALQQAADGREVRQ